MVMLPSSGQVSPAITCNSVLLPEPLAPITARNCPRAMVSEISRKAST